MSFYRALFVSLAALMLSAPVFAEETMATTDTITQTTETKTIAADTQNEQAKVNINTASVKDLTKVKGINATKARAIVAYRKKNGDFKSVDDLAHVKGFKKMKSETVKDISSHLSVE